MLNPRLALFIGLISISIFPVLVKWAPVSGITSAFYRMLFGLIFILPYVALPGKFKWPSKELMPRIVLCGILFATDIAIWNLSIHFSNVTQSTLLANLAPVWVGIASFLFLSDKPAVGFWLGTLVALIGTVVLVGVEAFTEMKIDKGFGFAVLSGMLYAAYMLTSKSVLNKMDIVSFMTLGMAVSSIYLFVICLVFDQPVWHFEPTVWWVFVVQGLICQLLGWLTLNYAVQNMDAKTVSLSLLSQTLVSGLLAWMFIGEQITWNMVAGGIIVLAGIAITYQAKSKTHLKP